MPRTQCERPRLIRRVLLRPHSTTPTSTCHQLALHAYILTSDTRDFLKLFSWQAERGSRTTRRHPREDVGEDVGVGVEECGLDDAAVVVNACTAILRFTLPPCIFPTYSLSVIAWSRTCSPCKPKPNGLAVNAVYIRDLIILTCVAVGLDLLQKDPRDALRHVHIVLITIKTSDGHRFMIDSTQRRWTCMSWLFHAHRAVHKGERSVW